MYFLSVSSFHTRGKVNKGKRFTVAKWWAGTKRSFALRNARSGFRSILVVHVLANERGSILKWKLCINFIFENWMSFSTGSILNCLKRGAVWAL